MKKTFQRPKTLYLNGTKLLLMAVLIVFVIFPFSRMVAGISSGDFQKVLSSPSFVPAVINSLRAALVTTPISVTLGFALALCLQRTSIRGKEFLSVFLILPMLVPSISHGTGLTVLFGTSGVLTHLLGLSSTIYGFKGIVAGSVLYSYPVAFLMFNDVLRYEDSSPYEAAQVLGIPRRRQITALMLPYLRTPLISAVFSVFTLVVTDYGVPLLIGGKTTTLAVLMYQEVLGQLDFGKGSVIGLFLLIPALAAFAFNVATKTAPRLSYVSKPFAVKKNTLRDAAAGGFCIAVAAAVGLLFLSFAIFAFAARYPRDMSFTLKHFESTLHLGGLNYLRNSMVIAVITALLGTGLTFLTAYMTARAPSRTSLFLHLMSMTSMAIPGLVLGLAYALTFKSTVMYGTMAILILVNSMHFFASPYLMFYNSLSKLNENLESVGSILGIPRVRLVCGVIIPQSRTTFYEAAAYFFVNSMITISAVSFLANYAIRPVSLMIGQFQDQTQMECAAIVTLMILLVNVLMKTAVYCMKKYAAERDVSSVSQTQ